MIDRGTLQVVDNQVDQTTGTIKLKAEFPNADLQLWPGQFVNVRLLVDTLQQVVVVPTAAVQRGPNGTFVYVVQPDDTVAVRPVTVAQQDETQAVIASGLQAGERVVTTGFARLTDGARRSRSTQRRGRAGAGRTAAGAGAPRRRPRRRGRRGQARRGSVRRGAPSDAAMSVSDALHPPADRDLAARRRGPARRRARLLVAAGLVAAAGRFPDHPGDDPAARREPRHHRGAGDGAARAPVRPDPGALDR